MSTFSELPVYAIRAVHKAKTRTVTTGEKTNMTNLKRVLLILFIVFLNKSVDAYIATRNIMIYDLIKYAVSVSANILFPPIIAHI